jgi:hypothetical protein
MAAVDCGRHYPVAMGRISNSISIAKASWHVLKQDKELAVLPVLSFVSTTAVLGVFGGLAWITVNQTTSGTGSTEYQASPLTYVVGVLAYVAATFAAMFFLAALVSGAHQRLTGGSPNLGTALGGAAKRLPQIFGWSVLVATVGLILQAIEERAGFVGVIVANLIGMAWQIVTWLAVPVIIVEGTGPITSLKRAASLFRQTWGENLIAQAGFGLLGLVAALPGVVVGVALVVIGPAANVVLGIVLGVLWIAAVAIVLSALNGIYRTALYLYVATGEVPAAFPKDAVEQAFAPRSSGAGRFLGR